MLPIKQKWSGSKKNVGPYLLTIQKNPNTNNSGGKTQKIDKPYLWLLNF